MAKSLSNYFQKDSFYALLQCMEQEYGGRLEKLSKAQKAFLLFYLAYFILYYAEADVERLSAQDMIRKFNIPVFPLRFDEYEDENLLLIADLADRIVEASPRWRYLQMIAALTDLLLTDDDEEG